MRRTIGTLIFCLTFSTLFGQNGLKQGDYFILQKDKNTISINSFTNQAITEKNSYTIDEGSFYATDKQSKVVVMTPNHNYVVIHDIHASHSEKIPVPYDIKAETIFMNNENIFIGGELGKEMLVQYHLKSKKWYSLEIPREIMRVGKAIDDIVVTDSTLIAIDNIVIPKYILYYKLNSHGALTFLESKLLPPNGTYEDIYEGRINSNYLVLSSRTTSGYTGVANHFTIYNNPNLESYFAISIPVEHREEGKFNDFAIHNKTLIVAHSEKGLGYLEIKPAYFEARLKNSSDTEIPQIEYGKSEAGTVIDLTLVPNTETLIVTNKRGTEYEYYFKSMDSFLD
ncbi:MAG: hypothetical protein AB3N14_14210 [Flavobacteriaceae bacterium]